MLLLISPAKTLDYDTPVPPAVLAQATEPLFSDQAALLIAALRKKSPRQIGELMGLSDKLVALNAARYAAWVPQATADNSKPAVLAFDGDVYDGLQAPTLSAADLRWTQDHVVILSGLYGALRPLDWLQPYRLEMGTALKTRRGKDLYAFWGDRVAKHLNERQAGQAEPVIVNLASIEYARVARRSALRARVVDCAFEEGDADGSFKIISFFAKKARGMMVRHAIERRATRPEQLEDFCAEGYALAREVSTPDKRVFRRPARSA